MIEGRAMLQSSSCLQSDYIDGYPGLTDDALVTRAKDGNRDAFGELARRYRSTAVRTAASIVGPDRAEDVVQEALILAFRALSMLQDPRRFPQWLGTITRYRALRHGRKESRRTATLVAIDALQSELPARNAEEPEEETPDIPRLEAALDEIPQAFARVLRLHFLEGLPHQKIAERLGVSLSTSKWRCYRGKQLLRVILLTGSPAAARVDAVCERCRAASGGFGCEELFAEGAPACAARRGSSAPGDGSGRPSGHGRNPQPLRLLPTREARAAAPVPGRPLVGRGPSPVRDRDGKAAGRSL